MRARVCFFGSLLLGRGRQFHLAVVILALLLLGRDRPPRTGIALRMNDTRRTQLPHTLPRGIGGRGLLALPVGFRVLGALLLRVLGRTYVLRLAHATLYRWRPG
jgi:hypothetical protein